MNRALQASALIFLLASTGACGGRVAAPVPTTRDIDSQLTCDHLQAERENNLARAKELAGERNDKVRDNIGILLVSPLFLDFSETQKQELQALAARNDRLDQLAAARGCARKAANP